MPTPNLAPASAGEYGARTPRATADTRIGGRAASVARRIEVEVLRRGWPVGTSLGGEEELRRQFGVTRPVLREAVRLVEHHQVARMRQGPNGGLFVCAPDAGPATRAMVIYLEYIGTTIDDLIVARRALEPLAAALAARLVTEGCIDLLRRTLATQRAATDDRDGSVHEAVHVVLADLSANPALRLFIEVLTRLTTRFGSTRVVEARDLRWARAQAQRRQEDIVAAVIAGDSGHAEARLSEYLDGVAAWLRQHPDTVPADLRRAEGAVPLQVGDGVKLAEVVAARIHEDIATAGWIVGSVVGSEGELLDRYEISRAVLREAVRLLEDHSVARMRRGRGGGLVVTRPDPQASIDMVTLSLRYQRVTLEDLRAVREAIELANITRVVAGGSREETVARLRCAARASGGAGASLHAELAAVAGNPVLDLFLDVLTTLWLQTTAVEVHRRPAATAAESAQAHASIVDAVLAGDESLARHRMRRHLQSVPIWCA